MSSSEKLFYVLLVLSAIPACGPGLIFHPGERIGLDEQGRIALEKGPYQCYLSPGNVIVAAEFPVNKAARLNCREGGGLETSVSVPFQLHWDAVYHAVPPELDLEKSYLCEIEAEGNTSAPFPLNPGSGPEEPFSFLVIGDTGAYNTLAHRKLVEQMILRDAAYFIHVGDYVKDGSDSRQWDEYFEIEKALLRKMPILPVIGNHDLTEAAIFSGLFCRDKRYYSVEYGNTLTIVLDSNVPIGVGGEQYVFLEKELERSRRAGIDHVFLAVHHPSYSSGKHKGSRMLQETVVPLAEKYGVTAVFSGHEHSYERTRPINGVVYIVTGGGGSAIRAVGRGPDTEKTLKSHHFVEITVEGKSVRLRVFDQSGKVRDEVVLE